MKPLPFIGLTLASFAFFLVSNMDAKDGVKQSERYCQQVALWESSHLSELDRPGHPNYKDLKCSK